MNEKKETKTKVLTNEQRGGVKMVSVQCIIIMWELCRSPMLMPCLQTIIVLKKIETGFAERF
jgi:hypothetical protein